MWSKDNNYWIWVKGAFWGTLNYSYTSKYEQFLKLKGFRKRKDGRREIGDSEYRIVTHFDEF